MILPETLQFGLDASAFSTCIFSSSCLILCKLWNGESADRRFRCCLKDFECGERRPERLSFRGPAWADDRRRRLAELHGRQLRARQDRRNPGRRASSHAGGGADLSINLFQHRQIQKVRKAHNQQKWNRRACWKLVRAFYDATNQLQPGMMFETSAVKT